TRRRRLEIVSAHRTIVEMRCHACVAHSDAMEEGTQRQPPMDERAKQRHAVVLVLEIVFRLLRLCRARLADTRRRRRSDATKQSGTEKQQTGCRNRQQRAQRGSDDAAWIATDE